MAKTFEPLSSKLFISFYYFFFYCCVQRCSNAVYLPMSHRTTNDEDGLYNNQQHSPAATTASLYDLISSLYKTGPQIFVLSPNLSPMSLMLLPHIMNALVMQEAMLAAAQTSNVFDTGLFLQGADFYRRGQNSGIESRTRPISAITAQKSASEEEDLESRLIGPLAFGLSNINRLVNPFASFFNALPPIITNPLESDVRHQIFKLYDTCQDNTGLTGICTGSFGCAGLRGRVSGNCGVKFVCCVNVVNACDGQMTLNNTYWQSPPNVPSTGPCSLTVRLDPKLVEQTKPICQIRLDLLSFTIAQPNTETVCNVDTFQVQGANSRVPVICGENNDQHMYFDVPLNSAASNVVKLMFDFRQSSVTRAWNIKVSLLPCGASYLAPEGCLQYFSTASGQVRSFNWKDVVGTTTRQLANQDYKICFKNQVYSSAGTVATCFTPCTVTSAGLSAFSVSRAETAANAAAPGVSQIAVSNCNNDYLLIPGGYDPALPLSTATNNWDRYCGERLNPLIAAAGQTTSVTVCTRIKPFGIHYKTNGDESGTATVDGAANAVANGNLGFCLDFRQQAV